MDKIILNSSCNCCNDDENILKITSGNDFSIEIQLTIKEGDEWVVYDMSDVDADSLVVNVVSPTGERYEIDAAISSNKVVGVVDANVLEQYVDYGIEVIWRDDPYDKRAYGPRVFELVDSSLEATEDPFDYDSDSPYEYNLHVNSDIAMLSIGQIPTGDFVTLEMLDEMSYVTQTSLNTTLSDYVTLSSLNEMSYVDHTYLYSYVGDAIAGVTIDESNLVHKTGLEDIYGQKQFHDNVVITGSKSLLVSGGIISSFTTGSSGLFPSVNLFGSSTALGLSTSRASLPQIATGEIIAPYSNYDVSSTGIHSKKDEISFKKITQASSFDPQLSTLAKIDSNGIYEGTTLLENKYLQIADLPTIPTDTSDLTNGAGFITNSDLTTTLADYVSQSSLDSMSYIDQDYLDNAAYITLNDIPTIPTVNDGTLTIQKNSLTIGTFTANQSSNSTVDISVPTDTSDLTNNAGFITLNDIPPIPNNVVTSDDGNEIICLTQSQYDTLEQNQQLESDVFYYITDATSNYVSQSDLTNYVTQTQLNTAISGVTIDETNLVHKTGSETITGSKTFQGTHYFNGECQFTDTQNSHTVPFADNLYAIAKSGIFGRGSFIQAAIGQIIAPTTAVSNSTAKYDNQVDTILFQKCDGTTGSPQYNPSGLTTLAKIDTNGIYEGTTLLSNKYASITDLNSLDGRVTTLEQSGSGVSQEDWDNANEAIAQELTDNRLAHIDINNQFSYYYTKTDSDSRYATQSWANNKFVTQSDDVNRQQAIAAAFSQVQDEIDGLSIPTATSDLTNDSGFVSSSSITTIWKGSQSDYNNISTPDPNTLYVIV